jgi:hypothetical protein
MHTHAHGRSRPGAREWSQAESKRLVVNRHALFETVSIGAVFER